MAAHARLSASGAHRWVNCPGSVEAEKGFPDTSSDNAREGTVAHWVGEAVLRGEVSHAKELVGHKVETDGKFVEVTADMARIVQDGYVDYILETKEMCDELTHIDIEMQVNFAKYVPEGFGTADCVMAYIEDGISVLHVIDLKYGHNPVDPEGNLQGLLYAIGAADNLEWLIDDVEVVRITIVQPRVFDEPQTWEIDISELWEWAEKIEHAAAIAVREDAERIPGELQCKYCKAKSVCRARRDQALEIARFEFDDDHVEQGDQTMPKPENMSLDEIADVLPHLDAMQKWIKDIQEYAYTQAMAGEEVRGYKLVEGGRKTKKWKDDAVIEEALLKHGYDMDDIYESKLLSPAKAEKLVGKAAVKEWLGDLYQKVGGKVQLVPEGDKRPEVELDDPTKDFD